MMNNNNLVSMNNVKDVLMGVLDVVQTGSKEEQEMFEDIIGFAVMSVGFTSAMMTKWANDADPEELARFLDMMSALTILMLGETAIDVDSLTSFDKVFDD